MNDGWRAAMSTSSNERGMSLRSPARFLAPAERLVELWKSEQRSRLTPNGVADAWIKAQAYRLHTFGTVITHGSSEAIYLMMHLPVAPGDEIVVVDPAYQQLYDIARWRGCRITRWPLRVDDGFRADLPRLRELARRRPRMIVVNFPHNPTGVTITPAEQDELVAIAAECDAWLVWDHAFGELTYTADPLPLPRYHKRICFGTFSKSYGLAGLRVGWCLAPPDLLARSAVLRDYIALDVSPLLQFFAERAVRMRTASSGISARTPRRTGSGCSTGPTACRGWCGSCRRVAG